MSGANIYGENAGSIKMPAWKLERYLLGELPADEFAKIQILENSDDDLRNELANMRAENAELLAAHPAADTVEKMQKVIPFPSLFSHSWTKPVLSACAALIVSLGAVSAWVVNESGVSKEGSQAVSETEETRTKGLKTTLEIWRKTADSVERLQNGSSAKEGDLLQLRYNVQKKCYGALLSLDGNGTLTIHLSGRDGKAALLTAGRIVSLEESYQLDNAPNFEKFYLITDGGEFSLAPIAEDLLRGKSPKNLQVVEVSLKK